MTQQRAAAVLKVDPGCLTRWAKKKDDFIANPKAEGKQSLSPRWAYWNLRRY
jgi:hypothetical protein